MFSSNQNIKLNFQNPWPGLLAYQPQGEAFFYGREQQVAELLDSVRLNPVTVLSGKSGLGKTSMLLAGLLPRLQREHFFPVYIALDVPDANQHSVWKQALRELEQALRSQDMSFPQSDPDECLWEYLHRRDFELRNKGGYLLTPVLVFDQFEEIFKLGQTQAERLKKEFYDLADLIENRLPYHIKSARSTPGNLFDRLDLGGRNYRLVLAFREDFLPEMRRWGQDVPGLLQSWSQLSPLTFEQAAEVVVKAGRGVIDEDEAESVANAIVRKVGSSDDPSGGVDPMLLNVCCCYINFKRGGQFIDVAMVEREGVRTLKEYYNAALNDVGVLAATFIEEKLVQDRKGLDSYRVNQALDNRLLTANQLRKLVDDYRLLCIHEQQTVCWIQLAHQRLVDVVIAAGANRKVEDVRRKAEADRRLAQRWAEVESVRADAEAQARKAAEQLAELESWRARANAADEAKSSWKKERMRYLFWLIIAAIVSL